MLILVEIILHRTVNAVNGRRPFRSADILIIAFQPDSLLDIAFEYAVGDVVIRKSLFDFINGNIYSSVFGTGERHKSSCVVRINRKLHNRINGYLLFWHNSHLAFSPTKLSVNSFGDNIFL